MGWLEHFGVSFRPVVNAAFWDGFTLAGLVLAFCICLFLPRSASLYLTERVNGLMSRGIAVAHALLFAAGLIMLLYSEKVTFLYFEF